MENTIFVRSAVQVCENVKVKRQSKRQIKAKDN